ncbi:MAG: peptidoglycan DD-metalloendopeptidase family protein [Kofleriaceae bacterium]
MSRASALRLSPLLLAVAMVAHAGDDAVTPVPSSTPSTLPAPVGDLRDQVRVDLAGQRDVAARTHTTVAGMRDEVRTARAARARVAYRALRPRTELGGDADAWLTTARRRAGVRLLLADDRREETLLAEEAGRLDAARARLDDDLASALALAPPPRALRWPAARVTIARDFGPFVHERSGARLSRRGVDLDVDDGAPALAPAAGVVRYAGPIRGLDEGVVLEHDGVVTVIGKLTELTVARGAAVAQGDRLGRAARRRLYFEVRLPLAPGGTPVPPTDLVAPSP